MSQKPLTKAQLRETLELINKHDGYLTDVFQETGIPVSTLRHRVNHIEREFPGELKRPGKPRPVKLPHETLQTTVDAVEKCGGVEQASRYLGVARSTVAKRMSIAARENFVPEGKTAPKKATKRPLPSAGVKRYVLTCAQSGTLLHEPTWLALTTFANALDAELMVSTFSYVHRREGSAKRGTNKQDQGVDWYDPRIEPFVVDEMVALAPSLLWHGHMNILPTATDPLSGMDNYGGRASAIYPHAKVALRSVAAMPGHAAKLMYTTGAATQLNYIQKKAGQKAEFDHVFGGLLVEVTPSGEWWARQLTVDAKGRIFDVLGVVNGADVQPLTRVEAVVFGDLHAALLDDDTRRTRWGPGGFIESLSPRVQIAHDILDFESQSHHNRKDPHKRLALHLKGRDNVADEVHGVACLLAEMTKHGRVVVASSNHDRHLERWLKEADWRGDPANAQFYVDAQQAYIAAIRKGERFDALKWAVRRTHKLPKVRFLAPGESFVVSRDSSGGVELGLHGDQGPNGARGSIRNLSKLGRKVIIGHGHSAGIFQGAWQVGVTAPKRNFDYAAGAPTSWSHADCLVHVNGKRQMIVWHNGKWRA